MIDGQGVLQVTGMVIDFLYRRRNETTPKNYSV